MKLIDTISELVAPILDELNLALWDVEFVKEGGEHYLRIYIDKQGGVAISDCEAVSRKMDALLDEVDPISEPYIFEVSSAGIERRLRKPSHFEDNIGSMVLLRTYSPKNGKKEFIGKLNAYHNGDVVLDDGEGFGKNEIALVRLYVEF